MPCASTPIARLTTPTPADIARRNGGLSKGPIAEAGKARSASNATRHGICARSLAPPDPADAAALAALRAAMLARHQPLDEAEAHWVEELVFVAWRQQRLRAVEDKVLTQAEIVATGPALPSLATLIRYRGRLDRDWRRAMEELSALRRGRKGMVDPAQLRWLAARLDHAQAAQAVSEPDASKCTNDLSPACTNEPAGVSPPMSVAPDGSAAPRTDEPRHPVPHLPERVADRPARSPIQPRNRHERRRLAALQRQAA